MTTKIPQDLSKSTPGKLVDLVWTLREQRKLVEARAELIKEDEDRIKDYLLNTMNKDELGKLAGKLAQCSVSKSLKPRVTDWDALNKYILEHDAWDLRNKAANAAAFKARWEAGEDIPGTEKFFDVSLNVRKL